VSITSGNGNSVERNVVSGALEHRSFGIQVSGSGNRIAGNTVSGFREAGVDVNGDASEVHDNVVTGIVWNPPIGVGGHGFNLSGANASIVGNRADDNSGIGFRFRNLSGSVVQANHACGNGVLDSVSAGLSGPANTFVDNTFCVSAQTSPLFLHVQGTSLSLDASAPTDVTVDFRDSASLKFAQFNESKTIGIWTGPPSESPRTLVELSDLRIWLGLKNSDDQGTRFNVYAEVLKNGMQATFGSVRCVSGVTRNAARALEVRVPFYPVPIWNSHFGPSDVLSLRISASIGTDDNGNFCGGHANATGLRLYFDAASRPAAFEALFIPD
jgi:hypothetical protein